MGWSIRNSGAKGILPYRVLYELITPFSQIQTTCGLASPVLTCLLIEAATLMAPQNLHSILGAPIEDAEEGIDCPATWFAVAREYFVVLIGGDRNLSSLQSSHPQQQPWLC